MKKIIAFAITLLSFSFAAIAQVAEGDYSKAIAKTWKATKFEFSTTKDELKKEGDEIVGNFEKTMKGSKWSFNADGSFKSVATIEGEELAREGKWKIADKKLVLAFGENGEETYTLFFNAKNKLVINILDTDEYKVAAIFDELLD